MIKEFNNVAGYDLLREIHLKAPYLIAQLVLTSVTKTIDESINNTMKTFQLGPGHSVRCKVFKIFFSILFLHYCSSGTVMIFRRYDHK